MSVKDRRLTMPQDAFCGSVAGVASRTLTAPLDVAKILSQVGTTEATACRSLLDKGGIFKLAWIMYRKEGWKSMFKGNFTGCVRMIPFTAVQYGTYFMLRETLLDPYGNLPPVRTIILGGICGFCATITTYPLDTVKTRLVVQPYEKRDAAYKSIRHALRTIYKDEGFTSMYRGMTTSLLASIPSAASLFLAYDLMNTFWPMNRDTIDGSFRNGVAASATSLVFTHPLETIRRKLQAKSGMLPNRGGVDIDFEGVVSCYRNIVQQQGYRALYRGFLPAMIRVTPYSAVMYVTYNVCKDNVLHYSGRADMEPHYWHEDAGDHELFVSEATPAKKPFHPHDQTDGKDIA